MDISKLKFDIDITYDCDEGEGCDATLEDGTYEQAKHLLEDLEGRTWITGYYHYMSINQFDMYDENGEQLDFSTILDGDYEWVGDSYSTSDKDLAAKRYCLEIETVNRCSENGYYTLIGVVYPRGYKKIWFNEDELTQI